MPDIGYLPDVQAAPSVRRTATAGRWVLAGAVVTGIGTAALVTSASEAARAVQAAGPELTWLLRMMAGLKMLFAAGLLGVMYWRLAVQATSWRLAGYGVAAGATVGGPVLIWQMAHVGWGALLLHGGLLTGVLLLWRDPAMATRLDELTAFSRRRRERTRS